MADPHPDIPETPAATGAGLTPAPLLDTAMMLQWTEDLTAEQVLAILKQVPSDSRSNAAAILAAVERNDLPAARRQAHRLKGMAASIGAPLLAAVARDIEHSVQAGAELDTLLTSLSVVLDDTLVAIADLAMAV